MGLDPSPPEAAPIPSMAPQAESGEEEQPGRVMAQASPSGKGGAGAWMGMLHL